MRQYTHRPSTGFELSAFWAFLALLVVSTSGALWVAKSFAQEPSEEDAQGEESDSRGETPAEDTTEPAVGSSTDDPETQSPPADLGSAEADNPEVPQEGTPVRTASGVAPQPTWKWRQVLSIPRIGGRMSAIATDPRDPKRIYVGTEEGTLLRSLDTGVTWREIEARPSVVSDRTLTLIAPGLPALGATTPSPLQIFFDPPSYQYFDRVFVTGVQLVMFSTLPSDMVVGFVPIGLGVPQNLLMLAERSRRKETNPVRRIAICPGAEYELIMATKKVLLGSQDGGLTFVRLFGLPGVELLHVVCSENNPDEIFVATGFGLFRSLDGGLTFDQLLVGWPGAPATAVRTGVSPNDPKKSVLLAAWGSGVWAGDPDSDKGLSMLYPDFQNNDTAPWTDVRWIDISKKGHIWMATDDGIRVSFDGGQNWKAEARSLFEREKQRQVLVGPSEYGGERVAVMTKYWIYATDDDGKSWHPFFNGLTPRAHKQMAVSQGGPGQPPGWWVVTSGELWTTVPPGNISTQSTSREMQEWARDQLARTKPFEEVIHKVLDRTRMSRPRINAFARSARIRNRLPIFSTRFTYNDRRRDTLLRGVAPTPVDVGNLNNNPNWELLVQVNWPFTRGFLMADEEYNWFQRTITGLYRQVRFITQDSWHERDMLLKRIAANEVDGMQAEILKTRIEALEAIVELWMEEPIVRKRQRPSKYSSAKRRRKK